MILLPLLGKMTILLQFYILTFFKTLLDSPRLYTSIGLLIIHPIQNNFNVVHFWYVFIFSIWIDKNGSYDYLLKKLSFFPDYNFDTKVGFVWLKEYITWGFTSILEHFRGVWFRNQLWPHDKGIQSLYKNVLHYRFDQNINPSLGPFWRFLNMKDVAMCIGVYASKYLRRI